MEKSGKKRTLPFVAGAAVDAVLRNLRDRMCDDRDRPPCKTVSGKIVAPEPVNNSV